jgi:hypothetical protein
VARNLISDGNGSGISLEGDSRWNTVIRNDVIANGDGIRLLDGASHNVISAPVGTYRLILMDPPEFTVKSEDLNGADGLLQRGGQ